MQTPHCKAAPSRNVCCSGCRWSPSTPSAEDRPSTVSRSRPWASGANTRHAQVTLPSIRTEQAPQSPVPQPSLAPVSPSSSRRASSNEVRVCEEVGVLAVDGAGDVCAASRALSAARTAARLASTPATWTRYSIVLRLSLIGFAAADAAAATSAKGRLVEARADEGRLGIGDPHGGGCNGAEHHTGIGAGVTIHRDADSGTDDGDVHLCAGCHPDVRIAGVRWGVVDLEFDDELTLGQRELAGAGDDIGDRDGALAVGAGDHCAPRRRSSPGRCRRRASRCRGSRRGSSGSGSDRNRSSRPLRDAGKTLENSPLLVSSEVGMAAPMVQWPLSW